MSIHYPVRHFRCPFCNAKMPTEEYKGWKPWKCPGCSRELQFSEAYGWIVQLCFFGVVFLSLYLLGLRGWHLLGAAVLVGSLLTVVLIGPLHRILPPRLEAYRPPPWKEDKFTTLFHRDHDYNESAAPKDKDRSETPTKSENDG